MIHLGCSGFPVPATRYLKEFKSVEVADTLLGVPGPALVRRWRREAPEGFLFTAIAPKEVSAEGFKPTAEAQAAWEAFLPVVRDLDARAIIVTSAADMTASKLHRASVRAYFESLPRDRLPPLVWEAPATWEFRDAEATVKDLPDGLKENTLAQLKRAVSEKSAFWIGTDGKTVIQAGAKDHFDYVTLHPYEVLGCVMATPGTERGRSHHRRKGVLEDKDLHLYMLLIVVMNRYAGCRLPLLLSGASVKPIYDTHPTAT